MQGVKYYLSKITIKNQHFFLLIFLLPFHYSSLLVFFNSRILVFPCSHLCCPIKNTLISFIYLVMRTNLTVDCLKQLDSFLKVAFCASVSWCSQ